jgi:hypothetical protein
MHRVFCVNFKSKNEIRNKRALTLGVFEREREREREAKRRERGRERGRE